MKETDIKGPVYIFLLFTGVGLGGRYYWAIDKDNKLISLGGQFADKCKATPPWGGGGVVLPLSANLIYFMWEGDAKFGLIAFTNQL